jgi:hypothetical protein
MLPQVVNNGIQKKKCECRILAGTGRGSPILCYLFILELYLIHVPPTPVLDCIISAVTTYAEIFIL